MYYFLMTIAFLFFFIVLPAFSRWIELRKTAGWESFFSDDCTS